MFASTAIPDLTPAEYKRMTATYPLLSMREKLAVHKYAQLHSQDALSFRQPQQPTDPKAIR